MSEPFMLGQPSNIQRDANQDIKGMDPPLLDNYPDAPVYDHNLILRLVNVRPIALWALEQHLGISSGARGVVEQSGHKRRYSERELIALLWMRERIVAGEQPQNASARLIAAQRQRNSSVIPMTGAQRALKLSDPPAANSDMAPDPTQPPLYPGFSPGARFLQAPNGMLSFGEYSAGVDPTADQPSALGASIYAGSSVYGVEAPMAKNLSATRTTPIPIVRPATGFDSIQDQAAARELRGMIAPLMQAFSRFDTAGANKFMQLALERYSVESVCLGLAQPVIARISDLWSRDELTIPEERFAYSYLRGFLTSIFHSTLEANSGKLVALGCAQHDAHDLPTLLLAVFMRRAGLSVIYLGADAGVEDLARQRWDETPALIVLTLASPQRIRSVNKLAKQLRAQKQPHPDLAYTGAVFARNLDLQRKVNAIYLGDDPAAATLAARRKLGAAM